MATKHELDVLAAWWWTKGSYDKAAFLLGIKKQSVKNALYTLRRTEHAESNIELVMKYMDEITERRAA